MSATMLYRNGISYLHRADPRAKILALLVVLALALSTTGVENQLLLLLIVIAGLQALGGLSVRGYWKGLAVLVPFTAVLMLLQAILQSGATVATIWGVGLSSDGLYLGLGIALRLVAMGLAFYGFSATTSPQSICLALERMKVPYKAAFLTSFAFRFLPLIEDEGRALMTAMAVRGSPQPFSRNPVSRIAATIRMIFPMLVSALRRSRQIALSMELRGYSANLPRSSVHEIAFRTGDYVFMGSVVILGSVLVILRVFNLSVLSTGVVLQ